jgi:hypothetical protein
MTPTEIKDLWRIEFNDTIVPYRFADSQVFTYLNEAQKMLARETGGIPDSESALTTIVLTASDPSFELDEKVLKVRKARFSDTGKRIDIINEEDMEANGMYFDGAEGTVRALVIGMDETTVYPYRIPKEETTVRLTIDRMPLTDIGSDGSGTLEVASRHHFYLMEYMKALAYGNQDSEVFNKAKATEHRNEFLGYCARVKAEKDRRKHKTRVVRYGGLGMQPRADEDY